MYKVSVIVPTYNRPGHLFRAVESLTKQSVKPNEILIVNDGDWNSVISNFGQDKTGLIKVLKTNGREGGNTARNLGARNAAYEVLMFLDDDDYWGPNKIENQLRILSDNEEIGLVYSNRNVVDEKGDLIRQITSQEEGHLYPKILFSNIIGTTSSVAIKKDLFFQVREFDLSLPALQDYDLWIRACKETKVGLDSLHSVNYTISTSDFQVSKSGLKKEQAVKILLDKYQNEMSALPLRDQRKIRSNLIFYIAKSYRGTSFRKTLTFALRSFIKYPNIRVLGTLLPSRFISKMKNS